MDRLGNLVEFPTHSEIAIGEPRWKQVAIDGLDLRNNLRVVERLEEGTGKPVAYIGKREKEGAGREVGTGEKEGAGREVETEEKENRLGEESMGKKDRQGEVDMLEPAAGKRKEKGEVVGMLELVGYLEEVAGFQMEGLRVDFGKKLEGMVDWVAWMLEVQ